jgi:hypothetical protein
MKHNGIIAIVFVVGCGTRGVMGGGAAQLVVPPVRAGTSPTRWEYQCSEVDTRAEEITGTLNKLGAEGWELASMGPRAISGGVYGYLLCAKRALP